MNNLRLAFRTLFKTPFVTIVAVLSLALGIGANVAMKGQTPLNGEGMLVSGSYFPTLGIRPALGRLFSPNDDQTIGGHPIAVLNYAFWETRLGSDPNVLNQQITVNGQQLTIIGVGPKNF